MIRNIVRKEEPILHTKSQKVHLPQEKSLCQAIVQDLKDTILDHLQRHEFNKGIALAAPQIGMLKRIFVIKFPHEKTFRVFINPVVLSFSKQTDAKYEGCLSFFEFRGEVERPLEIVIQYMNEDFVTVTETYKLGNARLIQHECDHLDGKLYIDKMPKDGNLIPYEEYVGSQKADWKYPCEE